MPNPSIARLLLALFAGAAIGACTGGYAEENKAAPEGKDMTEVEHPHTNRLAKESSPYLLQHAHNPVDWYPWGDEAFAKAKAEDKPIFLSIGYATCHWCHVMERESFENEEIAAYLNAHFVPVKVDREERPDVDNVYMAAVQSMTGSGGWPLSIFLTPERKPFWGGTYFPPDDRYGRPGFMSVLTSISEAWKSRRGDMAGLSDRMTKHLEGLSAGGGETEIGAKTLAKGFEQFAGRFDATHGGFENAPKFPRCHGLSFLLRYRDRSGEKKVLPMVEKTLDCMWRGGVYDHLGGGFHRYSTDAVWLVPHFEKMLYDQALIARAAIETWQVTADDEYADIARDIFRYVLRDMTDAGGGFYSAEDADSEGVEGKFYVWTDDEIADVLGDEDGELFASVYGVTDEGNFKEEATGGLTGENILHLPRPLAEAAGHHGMDVADLDARLAPMREKLFAVRENRIHPLKDDKILTDWNGLMISSLAHAGRVLGEERYVTAAARAADFILKTMDDEGRLLHRYRLGNASIKGFLDDYAFMILGLVELYEATFEARWLEEAKRLSTEMVRLFWDEDDGGFLFSGSDGEELISATKEIYDGAVPSGNSAAILGLLRVGRLTGDGKLEETAREALEAFSGKIDQFPMGYPFMLMALDFAVGPTREIVLSGEFEDPGFEKMARVARELFLPRAVLLGNQTGAGGERICALVPFLAAQPPVDGKATAYVCEDYACREPVTTAAKLREELE